MTGFNDLPNELKFRILELSDVEDDPYYRGAPHRTRLIGNIRLTSRANAIAFAPAIATAIANLRTPHITLGSRGVSQLAFLVKSPFAQFIDEIRLCQRFICKYVCVRDALSENRDDLPKSMLKRIEKIERKQDVFPFQGWFTKLSECLRPMDMSKIEWKQEVEANNSKRILGTRPLTELEYRALVKDDGAPENLARIASMLASFPALKSIKYSWAVAAQQIELHDSGETDLGVWYRLHGDPNLGTHTWTWPSRPQFSAHVLRLLQASAICDRIKELDLPVFGHGSNIHVTPVAIPDEHSYVSLFMSLTNLTELHLQGSEWDYRRPNDEHITTVSGAIIRSPIPTLEKLVLDQCSVSLVVKTDDVSRILNFMRMVKAQNGPLRTLEFTPHVWDNHRPMTLGILKIIKKTSSLEETRGLDVCDTRGPVDADNIDECTEEYSGEREGSDEEEDSDEQE